MEVARELQGQKLPYYSQSTQMVLAGYPPQDVVADLPSIEGELRQQFTFSGGKEHAHAYQKAIRRGDRHCCGVDSTRRPGADSRPCGRLGRRDLGDHVPRAGSRPHGFIELANRSNASVDISGWSFSAGITLVT